MKLEQKDYCKVPNALAWMREVFDDANNWTGNVMYRYAAGQQTGAIVKCCTIGAVFLASRDPGTREEIMEALRSTPEGRRWSGISIMNDKGGLPAVRNVLREATEMFPVESL